VQARWHEFEAREAAHKVVSTYEFSSARARAQGHSRPVYADFGAFRQSREHDEASRIEQHLRLLVREVHVALEQLVTGNAMYGRWKMNDDTE